MKKVVRLAGIGVLSGLSIWCLAAVAIDGRRLMLPIGLAVILAASIAATCLRRAAMRSVAFGFWLGAAASILVWWFSLKPSNNRNWQPDVARMPWATVQGDTITIHNIRNFVYRSEFDYAPRWEDDTVSLSKIEDVDLFLTYWGSPWIAHAIVSFHFGGGKYLAMSIEVRKEIGESYSALLGFFRQYELIYLVAREEDVVRLRTNYRQSEFVHLYHTKTTPKDAQALFRQYLQWMNKIRQTPEWYNAFTSNCTTSVTSYLASQRIGGLSRFDWRTVFNGKGDEMLYRLGDLAGDLPFEELKTKAVINSVAQKTGDDDEFSATVRTGRPGFEHVDFR